MQYCFDLCATSVFKLKEVRQSCFDLITQTVIETVVKAKVDLSGPKKVGKIDLDKPTEKKDEEKPKVKAEPVAEKPKTKAKAEQSKETAEVVEKKPVKKEDAEKSLEEPLEEKLKTKE